MSRATQQKSRHTSNIQRSTVSQRARSTTSAAPLHEATAFSAVRGVSNAPAASSVDRHGAPPPQQQAAPKPSRQPNPRRYQRLARDRRKALILRIGVAVIVAVVALGAVFYANHSGAGVKAGEAGQYQFAVANPAKGALAPDFALPSTTGGSVRLSAYRGKNVLLYFQEGIGCEGCWTQLKDIQGAGPAFQRLDISAVLTITTNPLGALKQKVADEGINEPVLSDESFEVSRAYNAMAYGMMSGTADGHTFILVGPDGHIQWRADYGGPPNYTMYIPVDNLVADIKSGLNGN